MFMNIEQICMIVIHSLTCCLCPDIETESLIVYETAADDDLANNIQAFISEWVNRLLSN